MAQQYKVTYTLFTDSSHTMSQSGMSSLTMVVSAETNTQACDIVQAMMGPNAGYITASLL